MKNIKFLVIAICLLYSVPGVAKSVVDPAEERFISAWEHLNGVTIKSNGLQAEGGHLGDNASAISKNVLPEGVEGWAEIIAPSFTSPYLIGFVDANSGPEENVGSANDVNFGFYINDNQLYAYASGNFIPFGNINTGDILKLVRRDLTFYLYVNTVEIYRFDMPGNQQSCKLKVLMAAGEWPNIECSFDQMLAATSKKNHANYGNLHDGFANVIPSGGKKPYTMEWPDGMISSSESGLFPGTYEVIVRDANNQSLLKKVDVGVQPSWKLKGNIIYKSDSVKVKDAADGFGVLVSNNVSFKGEEAWYEVTPDNISSDYCFGFIGNNSTDMDSSFVPRVFPGSVLAARVALIKSISAQAFNNTLTYTDGHLNIASTTNNLLFAKVHNNAITILVNGASSTQYNFNAGDILRVGRKGDGTIYFRINEDEIYTGTTNVSAKYLLSSLILKSLSSGIRDMGIYTNATEENYSYRISGGNNSCGGETCKNWTVERVFDEQGNVISEAKEYSDSFGRPTQQQKMLLTEGFVIGAETFYDSYGRTAGSTLPASFYNGYLCYAPTFFSNSSNQHYSIYDYDKPNSASNAGGERNNPAPVGNTVMGTLGWYYSNNNTNNTYVAADSYPYSRIEYSDDPLSRVIREGGVGRMHKFGSGHETQIYYMNGLDELKRAYRRILNSPQTDTYELDDDFKALAYNGANQLTILNPLKKVVVNADGHDEISYTTAGGKLLATCTSGYDASDCGTSLVENKLWRNKRIQIHLPKEVNTTLKITDPTGGTAQLAYCGPSIWLSNTKYKLVNGTDYSFNTSTGAITFLGGYANAELFLEIAFAELILATPPNPTSPEFKEVHQVGYTNWTVYYYDVKGRVKAYISPNEFVCQAASTISSKTSSDPMAFSCGDNYLSKISLDGAKASVTDKLTARVQIEPTFNFFSTYKTTLGTADLKLQSDTSLAPIDAPKRVTALNSNPVDSFPVIRDTLWVFSNDSIHNLALALEQDSAYKKIGKKSIRYRGNYIPGKRYANGSAQYLSNRTVPFDYTLEITNRKAIFVNNLPGDKPAFYLDSTDLVEASEIVVKSANLTLQLSGFYDSPINEFNPCDLSLYVGAGDAALLANINANVGINTIARLISTPQSPVTIPSLPDYSKKFYYNEYDHLVATKTPDEGRKDYFYDLKEDKPLFTQDDRQRAAGGKFTYVKYDMLGRKIETGEFDPAITDATTTNYKFQTYEDYKNGVSVGSGYTSVGVLAGNAQNLPATPRCTDATITGYDLPYTGTLGFNYLNGKVSYVSNANNIVKYSYTEQGRVESTEENFNNLLPGTKKMNYNYNFMGNLVATQYQKGTSEEFTQKYKYDPDQRLIETYYATYAGASMPVVYKPASKMSYYMHGPMKRKVLGDNLQGLDYVYTIRGNLKSVNTPHMPISGGTGDPGNDGVGTSATRFHDFFGYALDYYPGDYERSGTTMEKTYDAGSFSQLNISYGGMARGMRWRTGGASFMYEYNYDELYRLKDAEFGSYTTNATAVIFSSTNSYKLSNITYDRNGNIQTLKRYAYTSNTNSPVLMDDLNYKYNTYQKNRLERVVDNMTASLGLGAEYDFPNQTATFNYGYDATGKITSNYADNQVYEYSYAGLVTRIKTNTGVLVAEFGYNSAGLRQWKKSYNSSGTQIATAVYDYDIFGAQICTYERTNFNAGILPTLKDYNINAAGRIGLYDVAASKPYFELTDHLGNVRVVFTDAGTQALSIIQTNDYYPHGGPLPGTGYFSGPAYRYGYQGKEIDPETKLTNFELRQMDPRLGRWLSPDPMGQHHSPYIAMNNNPANLVDPDGGRDYPINYYDANGNSTNGTMYSNTGVDMSFITGVSINPNAQFKEIARILREQASEAAAKSEERLSWHNGKESRGIRMSNYLHYKAAHQNNEGEWGSYASDRYAYFSETTKENGGWTRGRTFIADAEYKIDRESYMSAELQERLNRGNGNGRSNSGGGYRAGAIVISAGLLADDFSGIGVLDDLAIPFLITGGYVLDKFIGTNEKHTSDRPKLTTTYQPPSQNPINNRPGGIQNPKDPNNWLGAAKWLGAAGAAYRIYQNFEKQTNNFNYVAPTVRDNTSVSMPMEPFKR